MKTLDKKQHDLDDYVSGAETNKQTQITHHPVLSPVRIGLHRLNNRVVVAPMSRVSTMGDGVPTDQMALYYSSFVQGGFSLVITEGTYTDSYFSQAYPNQPGIVTTKQKDGWKKIVEAVHNNGGKIVMQLMHAGALSQHLSDTRGPSAIKPLRKMLQGYSEKQGQFPVPESMSASEIMSVKDGFVSSALMADEIGFDGVEVHGANGYLLDQFLTSYTNQRNDQYGGSVKKRLLLTTEIIIAICQVVNPSFIVGVRLSQGKVNDFDYKWPGGLSDGDIIFPAIKKAGADYIHFASEGAGFDHGCLTEHGDSLPKQARDLTGLPVIANGGMHDENEAERVLNEGHGDLVSIGTGALVNPDWPNRLKMGHEMEVFDPEVFKHGVTIDAQNKWTPTCMHG